MVRRAVHVTGGDVDVGAEYVDIERVRSGRQALDRLEAGGIDCVVCRQDLDGETGLDVADTVRERNGSVPVLLYTETTDGDVAIEATRRGVTEYASLERLRADGDSLGDRVRTVIETRNGRTIPYDPAAIAELTRIASDDRADFDEKVSRLLDLGRDVLGLGIGFVSEIDGDTHNITHARGDDSLKDFGPVDLTAVYCQRTVEADGLYGFTDAEAEGWAGDPAYEESGLSCYLGGKIVVDDELYGTLCFADESPRAVPFSESERTFIELLVEWLGHEIARQRREASLRRYKAIHETVQQMVFVIGEGTEIELLTEPLADRFGYTREELQGTSATSFLSADAIEAGFVALEELQSAPANASRTFEATLPTADGEAVPVEIEVSLLSNATDYRGMVGVVHDRSDLAATEAELAAERDRFRYLFEHIPDPVVETEFVDGRNVVRAVNPAFEERFGYAETDAAGRPINDLIVPEDERAAADEIDERIRGEGSVTADLRRSTTDGYRRFLFRGFEYRNVEQDRAFGIYTDITERAEREEYLQVVNRILRHNLRNDLSIVIGFAEALAEDATDERVADRAETIRSTAERLSRLAETANEMSRIVGQRSSAGGHEVDLAEVVERVRTEASAAHPEAEFVSRLSDSRPIVADSELARVVRELVDNAVEYGPEHPRVEFDLRTDRTEEYVTLEISDNGPGIPTADRERVLGEREITQLDHAQGVGLWLAKWLTESYGGDIDFDVDGTGTTVLLRLPAVDGTPDDAADSE